MKDPRSDQLLSYNSDGKLVRRPISPFMFVSTYKVQISSLTSIMHRITGVALGTGTILFTLWLVSAAYSDYAFSIMRLFLASWIGIAMLFGFTFALFYHFCNGIRHLFWDAGMGFDLHAMHRSARIMIAASTALTILFWIIACLIRFSL